MMCPIQSHVGYLDQGRAAQNFSREIAQAGQQLLSLTTTWTEFSLGVRDFIMSSLTTCSGQGVVDEEKFRKKSV